MVAFTELPREQQTKDHLFGAVVKTLLDIAGKEIAEDE